jgi:type VI secretion system protein ImpM
MSQTDAGAAAPTPTGFYGKLPSLGDFVTRRLPAQFVQPWDLWLREAMAASQAELSQDWLDHYLTSPIWRFVLSPGLAGQDGWAGVLMPSVDRVGRYFPLTLARPLSPGTNLYRALCRPDWFERAEAVALSGLDDGFDLDAFETQVQALESPEPSLESGTAIPSDASAHRAEPGGDAWQMGVASPAQLQDACPVLLEQALGELFFAYSLWSTSGSERVAPSLLACQGLPNPAGFAALLAGDWGGRGWVRLGPA